MLTKLKFGWDVGGMTYANRTDGLTGIMIYTIRHYIFIKHTVIHEYGVALCMGGSTYTDEYQMIGINARKSHRKFKNVVIAAVEYVDKLIGD